MVFLGKAIAVFNQKGGVGKTTTNVNLSAALAGMKKKVLVIDNDPQGNLTSGLGVEKNKLQYNIYNALLGEAEPKACIHDTKYQNLYIMPSDVALAGAEIEMIDLTEREHRLRKVIHAIKEDYDYVLIDCPPSLGLLTINALVAADSILIPIQCEYYALEGVSQLVDTYHRIKKNLNSSLEIEGVLLTMYDSRTNLSSQVVDEVNKYFKDKVYKTVIPKNVRVAEAPSYGMPVVAYDKHSKGAKAYIKLAKEFAKR
ncbi:ParA family protein [Acidaminobacter hydrogenoformans]